jgi:protein gp37
LETPQEDSGKATAENRAAVTMSTTIEWTQETWNPTNGCSMAPGSELGGCLNCYAARNQLRRPNKTSANGKPFAIMTDNGPRWTGKVELIESKLLEPLHWKKPRTVFVNSMSDLFHENLPTRDIVKIFSVMMLTPWITYQVLTKRAKRLPLVIDRQFEHDVKLCALVMLGQFPNLNPNHLARDWPLSNLWLGVSVENPPTADERIPELLRTPAAVRFVSYEPALAEVDFLNLRPESKLYSQNALTGWITWDNGRVEIPKELCGLNWGIIGGESGPNARPFNLEWARSTIRQFAAAGVPLFVKQLGSRPGYQRKVGWYDIDLKDSKGGNMDEWPPDLRVREFPKGVPCGS